MNKQKKLISNQFDQSDKNIWMRKYHTMQNKIAEANAIADKILALEEQKMPILDEIVELRNSMVNECIHPSEHLVEYPEFILCKFCEKKFVVN